MSLGGPEILVIIVIAVLVLGPDKLPNALRMFGRTMGEVRKYQDMAKNEIEKAMNMADSPEEKSPTGEVSEQIEEVEKKEKVSAETEKDSIAPILDDEEELS